MAYLPAADDQRRDHQLLDGVRVGAGVLKTGMAARCSRRRDVVDAGAGAADGTQRRRDFTAVNVGGAQQKNVRVGTSLPIS
jgi:hypothetical protein